MLYIYIYGVCSCLHIDTNTDSAFYSGSKLAFILILEPELGFWVETSVPGGKNRDKISLTLKIFLRPARFDPKTSCLAHGFFANSPK